MKKPSVEVLCTVVIAALLIGGWWAVPSLQPADVTVNAEASVLLERARRLLHSYDAGLTYKSLLVAQLVERDLAGDPDDLSEDASVDYEAVHTAMWERYTPKDWNRDVPSPDRASYGNVSGQIREGLRGRDTFARENEQFLSDALRAVEQALAVTRGDASSRSHSEATRLKAVIQYHTGLAKWAQARLKQYEADLYRRDFVALAADAASSSGAQSLVKDCNIDVQIQHLATEIEKIIAVERQDADALAQLDSKIEDLGTYFAQASSRAEDAREEMQRLKDKGIDFASEDAVQSFRLELETQSRLFREASREAHALETGSLANAKLDRPGDYLDGRYVVEGSGAEPTAGFGLAHFRKERAVVAARLEGRRGVLGDLNAAVGRFEAMKKEFQAAQTDAAERIRNASENAVELFAELSAVAADAAVLEESALQSLDQAARTAQQAASNESQWVNDARQRTSGLSSEAAQRSPFQARTNDGWMKGHMAVQEADACLAKAWIHNDRLLAAKQNAEAIELVTAIIEIADADMDAEKEAMADAREAGIDEVTKARTVLDRNHREAGDHWTLAAQAAGTTYLLTLFGQEDYLADTISAYRNAIQGRETQPFATAFVKRLARLEAQ